MTFLGACWATSFLTGHLGGLQQGLDLDLSAFKNVSVDTKAKTLTVGGATLFADIYNPLYEAGFEVRMFSAIAPIFGLISILTCLEKPGPARASTWWVPLWGAGSRLCKAYRA